MTTRSIGIIGGSGAMGGALAARFVTSGVEVFVGSRDLARATARIEAIRERWPEVNRDLLHPVSCAQAVASAGCVVIAVPFDQLPALQYLQSALSGKLVLSTVNRLAVRDGTLVPLQTAHSAAGTLRDMFPTARVATAFNHVSARGLFDVRVQLDVDVLVCVDDSESFVDAAAVVSLIPGLQPVLTGTLQLAGAVEDFTSVVASINRAQSRRVSFKISDEGVISS